MIQNKPKLVITICLLGAIIAPFASAQVQGANTPVSVTSVPLSMGLVTYGSNAPVPCFYDENHVFNIAGEIVGFRSASNPNLICNASGVSIGVLYPVTPTGQ
jgi:hypothetical protein